MVAFRQTLHYNPRMAVNLFESAAECGCAAKVPAQQLSSLLANVQCEHHPNVLVGPASFDDAGVFRLDPNTLLVQTVDFFPPVARNPYDYGRIAAANALSDIYAMGGSPLSALCIVALPASAANHQIVEPLMNGACRTLEQANCALVGGHSILDPQLKFGFAVTGSVQPDKMLTNDSAKPGDWLVLTKPIGFGTTIMAARAQMATLQQEANAYDIMARLNDKAAALALQMQASCATDITGFGLLGHVFNIAKASRVNVEIGFGGIGLVDGASSFAQQGLLSAAAYSNRQYLGDAAVFDADVPLDAQDLLFDPQTSGGLLFCCPEATIGHLAEASSALDCPQWVIGRIVQCGSEPTVYVRNKNIAPKSISQITR